MIHYLFLPCPGGLESLVESELHAIGIAQTKQRNGGVSAKATLEQAYQALLWTRVASRVLLEVGFVRVYDEPTLYEAAAALPWENHVPEGATIAVYASLKRARLKSPGHAALRVKDAVVDRLREVRGLRPDIDRNDPDLRLVFYAEGTQASLYVDLAGSPLHQRGYRMEAGKAPLHPGLAAAMLYRAGWPELSGEGKPMLDPFCGSGTLLVEAAWMATRTAPGLLRERWGVEGWLGHDPQLFAAAREAALDERVPLQSRIVGGDEDEDALSCAEANLEAAGLDGAVELVRGSAQALSPPPGQGLVITNPPYGVRLGSVDALRETYAAFGQRLKEACGGWRLVLLTQEHELGRALGMKAARTWKVRVGALEAMLLRIEVRNAVRRAPEDPPRLG